MYGIYRMGWWVCCQNQDLRDVQDGLVGVLSESGFTGCGICGMGWWCVVRIGICGMSGWNNRKALHPGRGAVDLLAKRVFEITCPSGPLGPRQSCGEFGAALSSGALSRNHSCPLSAPRAPLGWSSALWVEVGRVSELLCDNSGNWSSCQG